MSGVRCHLSGVTCHHFFLDKPVELVLGVSVINVAYPIQFLNKKKKKKIINFPKSLNNLEFGRLGIFNQYKCQRLFISLLL